MHDSEPTLQNKTHKIRWNFKIHFIPATIPDQLLI